MSEHRIVGDIGGTNLRLALASEDGSLSHQVHWMAMMYTDLSEALTAYLATLDKTITINGAAFCAAGPVEGSGQGTMIDMTNQTWVLSAGVLAKALGLQEVTLVNDLTALAWAVPGLETDGVADLTPDRVAAQNAPIAVVAPGTGLGVSGLVPHAGGFTALASEGGHVDLAPGNDRELAILFQLQLQYGHVSAERVLSGPGLEALFATIVSLDGADEKALPTAADIAARARKGTCDISRETIDIWTGLLGAFAGDLALTLGAKGGVYLGGGILPAWGGLFQEKLFLYRFARKGRLGDYLKDIPVYLITDKEAALKGLA